MKRAAKQRPSSDSGHAAALYYCFFSPTSTKLQA